MIVLALPKLARLKPLLVQFKILISITLVTFKKKKEAVVEFGNQLLKNLPPNVKVREIFWTLGEYDSIWIIDAASEKEIFQMFLHVGGLGYINTQTLVAMSREEALKLLK
ncbi:MAG: GYD domain-containing protein [Nitrososphaeraceae archaeon]